MLINTIFSKALPQASLPATDSSVNLSITIKNVFTDIHLRRREKKLLSTYNPSDFVSPVPHYTKSSPPHTIESKSHWTLNKPEPQRHHTKGTELPSTQPNHENRRHHSREFLRGPTRLGEGDEHKGGTYPVDDHGWSREGLSLRLSSPARAHIDGECESVDSLPPSLPAHAPPGPTGREGDVG